MVQSTGPRPSDPRDLIEIAWRRKWVILVPFLLIGGNAAFLAKALPGVYRSTTVILVEKAKVPETFVRSTVTTEIDDRLATITQQILSRTRLEKIITQFSLYARERATLPMEDVVEAMRNAIEVQVLKGNNAFSVSYRGLDPRVVRDVTNELAAFFIEENSKVREEQATGTSEFLESQLAGLKQTLAQQEEKVRAFKERYLGELPQQQEANLRSLDRLQFQSQSLADQIRGAEERRLLLHVQLAQLPRETQVVTRVMRRVKADGSVAGPAGAGWTTSAAPLSGEHQDPTTARLDEARAVLLQLQARYTALHPDVLRAKRHVEELESLLANGGSASDGVPLPEVVPSPSASDAGGEAAGRLVAVDEIRQVPNPMYKQVEARLTGIDTEIAALRKTQKNVLAQVPLLERKVENVPKLEQQLLELTRDYSNIQKAYEALLSKKIDAQVAEDLEKRQKGEQFRVLDPALLPQTSYKPNRMRILALGLALGLGIGVAGAAGLEALDHSVQDARELKQLAPRLPLLGTIPFISDPRQARRRRLTSIGVGLLVLAVGTGAVAGGFRYRDEIVQLNVFEFLLR